MFCSHCNNLLKKITFGRLRYICEGCGSEYKTTSDDTLVVAEDNVKHHLPRNGKVIYNFPANQKEETPCPQCKASIVGFDMVNFQKVYGCGSCGSTWKVAIKSS